MCVCDVVSFCRVEEIDIVILDMQARCMEGMFHSCQQADCITFNCHCCVDIHYVVLNFQLELDTRFSIDTMKLCTFPSSLNPLGPFKSFTIETLCRLLLVGFR